MLYQKKIYMGLLFKRMYRPDLNFFSNRNIENLRIYKIKNIKAGR